MMEFQPISFQTLIKPTSHQKYLPSPLPEHRFPDDAQGQQELVDRAVGGEYVLRHGHHDHQRQKVRQVGDAGSLRAVGGVVAPVLGAVVHEGPPHQHAAVGRDGPGQHVRALSVAAAVGERAGAMLAVRLHQEARQVGHGCPDRVRPRAPPGRHAFVQRVGGGQTPHKRLGEADRDHQPHAVGPEGVRQPRQAGQLILDQTFRAVLHVDIVDAQHVDAHRGHKPPQQPYARGLPRERPALEPQRPARVAPLDGAVHVVPGVQHAQRVEGALHALGHTPAGRQGQQPGVGPVEHADRPAGDDRAARLPGDGVALPHRRLDPERGRLRPQHRTRRLKLQRRRLRGVPAVARGPVAQPRQPSAPGITHCPASMILRFRNDGRSGDRPYGIRAVVGAIPSSPAPTVSGPS